MEENLTQRAKVREKSEIAAKRHKTHKKVDLKFGKRTFTAALWIDGYHTTVVLQFSFFELFAPFRGYFCLLSFLCVFASLRAIFFRFLSSFGATWFLAGSAHDVD